MAAGADPLEVADHLLFGAERGDEQAIAWLRQAARQASGKAPLVASAMGRAVQALAESPDLEHLQAALPAVRQSAGLCVDCGKPYRGADTRCPRCRSENR